MSEKGRALTWSKVPSSRSLTWLNIKVLGWNNLPTIGGPPHFTSVPQSTTVQDGKCT
jgi:hypothetical protein